MTPYRERREQGYYDAKPATKPSSTTTTTTTSKPATAKRTTKRSIRKPR